MADKRVLCLGYGYVARRLAKTLQAEGWRVAGTARGLAKEIALEAEGVEPIDWDADALGPHAFDETSAVLVSTPPDGDGCPAYAAAESALFDCARDITWIGYLSSNGVYGDHGGADVDETSPLKATAPRAVNRVRAEEQWRELAARAGPAARHLPPSGNLWARAIGARHRSRRPRAKNLQAGTGFQPRPCRRHCRGAESEPRRSPRGIAVQHSRRRSCAAAGRHRLCVRPPRRRSPAAHSD